MLSGNLRKFLNVCYIHHRIGRCFDINCLCLFFYKAFNIILITVHYRKCDPVFPGYIAKQTDASAIQITVHDQMIAARDRGVGILLISADFDEILEMSDRILVCFEGQIMGEYSGKNPPIEEISLAMTGK